MDAINLKPCPLCGGARLESESRKNTTNITNEVTGKSRRKTGKTSIVRCVACNLTVRGIDESGYSAQEKWNTRAPLPPDEIITTLHLSDGSTEIYREAAQ